jgi:hypothetical protein
MDRDSAEEWTADQIGAFQDYFDALISDNLARRPITKFIPADFKLIETPPNAADSGPENKTRTFS